MTGGHITDRLSDWLDRDEGGLTAAERREMAAHLETCAACREALKQLEDTAARVAALPSIEAPRTVQDRARWLGKAHAAEMDRDAMKTSEVPRVAASARLSRTEASYMEHESRLESRSMQAQKRIESKSVSQLSVSEAKSMRELMPVANERRRSPRRVVVWIVIAAASIVALGLVAYALLG